MARRLSDSLINNAIKLYSDGLSIAKISTVLECSEEALRKRFKAIGVPVTKIGRYKGRNAILLPSDEIISMYDGGKARTLLLNISMFPEMSSEDISCPITQTSEHNPKQKSSSGVK